MTTTPDPSTRNGDADSKKRYHLSELIGYLLVNERHEGIAHGIGALALLWSAVNVILALFLIIPILLVKKSINRITRLDGGFDENNPGFWNPFDNILFNGIILLLGPIAIVVLASCYRIMASRWNVVKALLVSIVALASLVLEGFRIAYLVDDILHHTDEWDQATYIIAYVFCSAEVLFSLLFISGVKRIVSRGRASRKLAQVTEKV